MKSPKNFSEAVRFFVARPSKTAVRSQKLLFGLGSKCEVDIGFRGFEDWLISEDVSVRCLK